MITLLIEVLIILLIQHQYSISIKMEKAKDFVLECDFFSHNSFERYRQKQAYRTMTGGIISIILVIFFISIFSNQIIDTLQTNIITYVNTVNYDDDPTLSEMKTTPKNNFMFAIGLTGIDLNSSLKYFDIVLNHKSAVKTSGTKVKKTEKISLEPCTLAHWQGVSQNLAKNFENLSFNQWLCPPIDQAISLQGKYTSQSFQYAQIIVSKCTPNISSGMTCRNDSQVLSFLNSFGQFTFNIYYINPVVNAGEKEYLKYYLQDRNYFPFDTQTGVLGNLFFSDWQISSDESILPWSTKHNRTGMMTQQIAADQRYKIDAQNQYFKFYLRKSSSNYLTSRSNRKLDSTFSYIGGLFGTIILLLSFMNLYSKYCYEFEMGDTLFKQNNNDSFGSQKFNFLVFFGYVFFNILTKFNTVLEWTTMKKFHQCRKECLKQLNLDLLFKKIAHFQEISRIVLDDHHLKMLLMVPKPTIREARVNRKRFFVNNTFYNQIQNPTKETMIDQDHLRGLGQFIKKKNKGDKESQDPNTLKDIEEDIRKSFAILKDSSVQTDHFNGKIMKRFNMEVLTKGVFKCIQDNHQQESIQISSSGLRIEKGIGEASNQSYEISSNPFKVNLNNLHEENIVPVQFSDYGDGKQEKPQRSRTIKFNISASNP